MRAAPFDPYWETPVVLPDDEGLDSEWLSTRRCPVWVSTSGLAVPWLHVRLDSMPKYYSYRPYTSSAR